MASCSRRIAHLGAVLAAIAAAALAGCTTPWSEVATAARTKLVGMPADDLLLCMGPPLAKTREGTTDFWIYKSSAEVNSSATSTAVSRTSTTGVTECTANVALRAGKVAGITYSGQVHDPTNRYGPCYEIVAACMGR